MNFDSLIDFVKGLFGGGQQSKAQEILSPLPEKDTMTKGMEYKTKYDRMMMEESKRRAHETPADRGFPKRLEYPEWLANAPKDLDGLVQGAQAQTAPTPTPTPPPDNAALPYYELINQTTQEQNLPEHILYRLLKKESNFNPNAVSGKGAQGIAQIVPKWHPSVQDPFNPEEAIPYAGSLIKNYYNQLGDWGHALAGYNAGLPTVKKFGGIPPYPETQDYVSTILDGLNL